MSVWYRTQLYVKKRAPTEEYILQLLATFEKHGLRPEPPFPLRLHPSRQGGNVAEGTKASSLSEAIGLIARAGGGSISLEPIMMYVSIDTLGDNDHVGLSGQREVPLGSIVISWQLTAAILIENRRRFNSTLDLVKTLYPFLKPYYGFSYEGDFPVRCNLPPTETNILEKGPKDLWDVNVWGPEIAKKIPWRKLIGRPGLLVNEFEDHGVLVSIRPAYFHNTVNGVGYESRREAGELQLGWRK